MPYVRTSGPRRPRVCRASRFKSRQVKDQVSVQVQVQDKHELHEIMNMIASAMQIMNMIVSAIGPFSAKASAEASIFVSAARKTRKTRPSARSVFPSRVCPGSTEGFGMRFPSSIGEVSWVSNYKHWL